jgi:type IV pilus assembly protein PilV
MTARRRLAAGFALVESMVTIVVIAFGLLGVAGLVSRSFVTETEANQRTQAQLLMQDMVTRIEANRANAAAYVTGDAGVTGYVLNAQSVSVPQVCNPADPLATRDRCEWGRLISGAEERINATNSAVLTGAVGCVYELDAFNRIYAVAIAWQGPSAGATPGADPNYDQAGCGRNLYGAEVNRRLVSTVLRIGTLTPPAPPTGGGAGGGGAAGTGGTGG